MIRNYICKECGNTWESNDEWYVYHYIQPCSQCSKNTRPEKKPDIVHYAVRGQEPRHALCNDDIKAVTDNFKLVNVTCPDCLDLLSKGIGVYDKCFKCRNFTQPTNKGYWRFCIADPLPTEVDFEHTNFLSMDSADKGCTSQFEYKRRWANFFKRKTQKGEGMVTDSRY